MPLTKSDHYLSLWASCDAFRGGIDASLYLDYALFTLLIKYVSDKYANSTDFEPAVREGAFRRNLRSRGPNDACW